jgi:hypothetical protein
MQVDAGIEDDLGIEDQRYARTVSTVGDATLRAAQASRLASVHIGKSCKSGRGRIERVG